MINTKLFASFILLINIASNSYADQDMDLANIYDGRGTSRLELLMPAIEIPRATAQSMPARRDPLENFVETYLPSLLNVSGVIGALVGVDCPIKEPHRHIEAHGPAVVILVDSNLPESTLREHLLNRVPELARVPFRLEILDRAADIANAPTCFIPEGCGRRVASRLR